MAAFLQVWSILKTQSLPENHDNNITVFDIIVEIFLSLR